MRIAYLEQRINTPVYTTGDLLDRVIVRAREHFQEKPPDLTLEQWLYQIANQVLDIYISKRAATDARRRSLETLEQKERSELEEKITADAEGEAILQEDLDDPSYQSRDFNPPAETDSPEQELERKEQLGQVLQALSRIPEQDRIIFELFAIEGFSKEETAGIAGIDPEQVPPIVQRVRQQVLEQIRGPDRKMAS